MELGKFQGFQFNPNLCFTWCEKFKLCHLCVLLKIYNYAQDIISPQMKVTKPDWMGKWTLWMVTKWLSNKNRLSPITFKRANFLSNSFACFKIFNNIRVTQLSKNDSGFFEQVLFSNEVRETLKSKEQKIGGFLSWGSYFSEWRLLRWSRGWQYICANSPCHLFQRLELFFVHQVKFGHKIIKMFVTSIHMRFCSNSHHAVKVMNVDMNKHLYITVSMIKTNNL